MSRVSGPPPPPPPPFLRRFCNTNCSRVSGYPLPFLKKIPPTPPPPFKIPGSVPLSTLVPEGLIIIMSIVNYVGVQISTFCVVCVSVWGGGGGGGGIFPSHTLSNMPTAMKRTRDKWDHPSEYSTENCYEPMSVLSKQMCLNRQQRLKPGAIPKRPASVPAPSTATHF